MSFLSLSSALLLAGCATQALADPKVLAVPFTRTAKQNNVEKRDPAAATLANDYRDYLYSVQVQVGTPPQQMNLQLDTGSSDIWFFSPDACREAGCVNGTFDSSRSSTFQTVDDQGVFNISYADRSGASGEYISDTITLGNNLTVANQTMGFATTARNNTHGLFGVGFRANEAGSADYPTFVDSLVDNGVIESHSYSLWLDDLESSTGTILFGGYDPDQWTGTLTVLPILPDFDYATAEEPREAYVSFTVDLSMVALTDGSGRTTILNQAEYPVPAVLDSGTTLTEVPPDTFVQLANYFGATLDEQRGWVVDCGIANWRGTIDYGFGGAGGAIIQVPFSELAIRLPTDTGNMCQFGLDIASTGTVLVGDTFLRSAYVIYDIDAGQIGIAQSAWNSTTSNPRAIGADDDLATLIQGARNNTNTVPLRQYTSLAYEEIAGQTIPVNAFTTRPATASIAGVQTTLPVAQITGPSRTSTAGGAIQTAAMMLPMALPFAAALL